METLVSNVNRVISKLKPTVNIDASAVEEVVDLGDDEGVCEAEADEGGMAKECGTDRGAVRILNIP